MGDKRRLCRAMIGMARTLMQVLLAIPLMQDGSFIRIPIFLRQFIVSVSAISELIGMINTIGTWKDGHVHGQSQGH